MRAALKPVRGLGAGEPAVMRFRTSASVLRKIHFVQLSEYKQACIDSSWTQSAACSSISLSSFTWATSFFPDQLRLASEATPNHLARAFRLRYF